MDGVLLRDMRNHFGWTQERLAEALNVDVTTISRWERGKTRPAMTQRPGLIRLAASRIDGTANRAGAYGEAMLPPILRAQIKHHAGERCLLYSKQLILIAVSDVQAKRLPIWAAMIGHSVLDILPKKYAQIVDDLIGNHWSECATDAKVIIRFATDEGVRVHPRKVFRDHTGTTALPNLLDVTSIDITREEYERRSKTPEIFKI